MLLFFIDYLIYFFDCKSNVQYCKTVKLVHDYEWNKAVKTTPWMMSGGFLMFPKIVSETGICFTKAPMFNRMDF